MDRNTIIGLILIAGIVLTWSIFSSKNEPADQTKTTIQDSTKTKSTLADEKTDSGKVANLTQNTSVFSEEFIPSGISDSAWKAMDDSSRQAALGQEKFLQYGFFAPLMEGKDKVTHVVTEKLEFDIHSKGAIIRPLYLVGYQTSDGSKLPIITSDDANSQSIRFQQVKDNIQYPIVETKDLYFDAGDLPDTIRLSGDDEKTLLFHGEIAQGRFIDIEYVIKGNSHDYGFTVRQKGLNELVLQQNYAFHWENNIPKTEKAMALMKQKTGIYYREGKEVDHFALRATSGKEEYAPSVGTDWFAFKSQFFSHTLMTEDPEQPFKNLKLTQWDPVPPDPNDENSGDVVKVMEAELPLDLTQGEQKMRFFAGPCDYDILSKYENRDFIRQIELGWGPLKWVNQYLVIPIFKALEGAINNYGIIILILALLIKLALYPLTFKTYVSTAKMRVINQTPEIKALDEKYKDNPTKLQQEKMSIYRKMGVSMLGGCWPMLLQYPFLIALFFFFPNSIELRQESFLWAEDLSTYDSILDLGFNIPMYGDHVSLFTLLMTISIFGFTIINQKAQGSMTANPMMKYFPYIMPIIFLGFLNNYSAGLSWYYLLSNIISISQTLVSKRFINEEKLLADMHSNAKKKGNSKSKSRLEQWAEKQQQKQKQNQAPAKKKSYRPPKGN